MGSDELVMPWVDMANIACGFHASDPHVMAKTVALAKHYNVKVGAHPGYQDLSGFGRRSIPHTAAQITEIVLYQVGALKAFCQYHDVPLHYVKPHGALYNDMMADEEVFRAIAEAVSVFALPLMILATTDNQRYLDIADIFDVPLLFEAFADRSYQEDGRLTRDRKRMRSTTMPMTSITKRCKSPPMVASLPFQEQECHWKPTPSVCMVIILSLLPWYKG